MDNTEENLENRVAYLEDALRIMCKYLVFEVKLDEKLESKHAYFDHRSPSEKAMYYLITDNYQ